MDKTENLICRIEGHGKLTIDLAQNQVRLHVTHGERLFEQLVVGRDYQEVPFIASRICGVCPVAHALGSIKALEKALGVRVSSLTRYLRKLLLAAQIIQSHILHLFFLVLPDYTGYKGAPDLIKDFPSQYHLVLNLKRVTDQLLEIVAGRVVHPITPTVGGFLKMPDKEQLLSLLLDFENVLDEAEDLVFQFARLPYPRLDVPPLQLSLAEGEFYSVYEGKVISSQNFQFAPDHYQKFIQEEVKFDSTAKYSRLGRKGFMVGALARVNLQGECLHPRARKALEKSGINLPLKNPFLNNFAQSVEVLHFLEEILKILYFLTKESAIWKEEIFSPLSRQSGEGTSAIEAPRGTLYYWFKVEAGQVVECDIVTPTVQNLTSIEETANLLLAFNKNKKPRRKGKLVEMLIRAFDPCITCSVH